MLALAACCNYPKGYQTHLTEGMARRFLSGALTFAYDDPENADLVKQLLINTFGGAGMGTEHRTHSYLFCPFLFVEYNS